MRKAFTLLELMIIVVIVGIIGGIGIPFYQNAVNGAKGREAVAQLRLIQAAEKVEMLESDSYQACSGYAACNPALNIDLPDDGWTYLVDQVTASNFRGRAWMSMGGGTCTYTINATQTDPGSSSDCVYQP
ncbi:MAG: hypothetical protein ABIE75_01930 [Candidatus Omnitrophota bacterium]